jgi:rare lipoprotein A (peptidoglycan hydrolase)
MQQREKTSRCNNLTDWLIRHGGTSFVSLFLVFTCQGYVAVGDVSQREGITMPTTDAIVSQGHDRQIEGLKLPTNFNLANKTSHIQHAQSGRASWYGPGFQGKVTASGETFDEAALTAAHKSLPLGSKARVTNVTNGNSVKVKINDRGPFTQGRIIDLSRAAARALGILETGIAIVRVELVASESDK